MTDEDLTLALYNSRTDMVAESAKHMMTRLRSGETLIAVGKHETELIFEAFKRGWTVEQVDNAQNGIK